jgi:hypothetical protein
MKHDDQAAPVPALEKEQNKALTVIARPPVELMRQATDVAAVCGEIVKRTAVKIRDRGYVKVEGWEAIAAAHGCHAGADSATRDYDNMGNHIGYTARGYIRNSRGEIIGTGEGFVGFDETDRHGKKTWKERAEYAGRAMAQTRAISRACRSVFAHVVVLIDQKLSTTPAEEMMDEHPSPPQHDRTGKKTPLKTESGVRKDEIKALREFLAKHGVSEGFLIELLRSREMAEDSDENIDDLKDGVISRLMKSGKLQESIVQRWVEHKANAMPPVQPIQDAPGKPWKRPLKLGDHKMTPEKVLELAQVAKWQDVIVPTGANKDIPLGDLTPAQLSYYIGRWKPQETPGGGHDDIDIIFDAALTLAAEE